MELLDFLISGRKLSIFKDGQVFREVALRYFGFDNANGGTWKKYICIPVTEIPLNDSQYKIVIDSTNIYVYTAADVLKTSGAVSSDFWENVRSDGLDIRVFDQNFEQLYFWIESWDYTNKTAIIWVKLNAGASELNIAYGNPLATKSYYEVTEQTFREFFTIFFDDFDGSDVDISKWDIVAGALGNGNYSVSGSVLTIFYAPFQIQHVLEPGEYIVEFRYKYSGLTYYGNYQKVEEFVYQGNYISNANRMSLYNTDTASWVDVGDHYNNVWSTLKIVKKPSEVCLYRDDVLIGCVPNNNKISSILFGTPESARDCSNLSIDWVRVTEISDFAKFGSPFIGRF